MSEDLNILIQEYVQMRNTQNYNYDWFYRYYKLNSEHEIDFDSFVDIISWVNIFRIIEHIDSKFNLTRLYDKNNNFIKIITD